MLFARLIEEGIHIPVGAGTRQLCLHRLCQALHVTPCDWIVVEGGDYNRNCAAGRESGLQTSFGSHGDEHIHVRANQFSCIGN
jgi:hypothetical protein